MHHLTFFPTPRSPSRPSHTLFMLPMRRHGSCGPARATHQFFFLVGSFSISMAPVFSFARIPIVGSPFQVPFSLDSAMVYNSNNFDPTSFSALFASASKLAFCHDWCFNVQALKHIYIYIYPSLIYCFKPLFLAA